jgi:hypothetical protein
MAHGAKQFSNPQSNYTANRLKLAIIHYHLKPGGVSSVIRHQVQSLAPDTEAIILCGEKPPAAMACPTVTIPGLGYSGTKGSDRPSTEIAHDIRNAIRRYFGSPRACDLIHIHNPTLAKNDQFPDVIEHLQRMGYPLLLQIHDLAEDGRPDAYFRRHEYPRDCHYGVINRRDFNHLSSCGLSVSGLHYLPNAVLPPVKQSPSRPNGRYLLYPVRAIRRKNIGEALLLSLFLPPGDEIFITLPPNSPADIPSYNHWRQFAASYRLPVHFEMGLKGEYAQLVQQSRHVISTSISEGFGFAFLEPWLAGKSMEGRRLDDICADFIDAGLDMDHLYSRIEIPVDWIGRSELVTRFQDCYRHNCRRFGVASRMPSPREFSAPFQSSETVDFGMLDEPLQAKLVHMLHAKTTRRAKLAKRNPHLLRLGAPSQNRERIDVNRRIVRQSFGLSAYGQRLQQVYRQASRHTVRHQIDKFALLKRFMHFRNFSLLKWNAFCG